MKWQKVMYHESQSWLSNDAKRVSKYKMCIFAGDCITLLVTMNHIYQNLKRRLYSAVGDGVEIPMMDQTIMALVNKLLSLIANEGLNEGHDELHNTLEYTAAIYERLFCCLFLLKSSICI